MLRLYLHLNFFASFFQVTHRQAGNCRTDPVGDKPEDGIGRLETALITSLWEACVCDLFIIGSQFVSHRYGLAESWKQQPSRRKVDFAAPVVSAVQ